jgi:hypothetical protein
MKTLAQIAKALIAALIAAVGALGTAVATGESLGDVDAKTWLAVALVALVALGGVYTVPNKTAPPAA